MILITDINGLSHTSLLVQNFWGEWFYFYWGADGTDDKSAMAINAINNQPGNGNLIYTKLAVDLDGPSDKETLSKINDELTRQSLYDGKYDLYSYIVCNSMLTHIKANSLMKNQENDVYRLLDRNCAQVSLEVIGPSLALKYIHIFKIAEGLESLKEGLYDVGSGVLPTLIHLKFNRYMTQLEKEGLY